MAMSGCHLRCSSISLEASQGRNGTITEPYGIGLISHRLMNSHYIEGDTSASHITAPTCLPLSNHLPTHLPPWHIQNRVFSESPSHELFWHPVRFSFSSSLPSFSAIQCFPSFIGLLKYPPQSPVQRTHNPLTTSLPYSNSYSVFWLQEPLVN